MPDVKETEDFKRCVRIEVKKKLVEHAKTIAQVLIFAGVMMSLSVEIAFYIIPPVRGPQFLPYMPIAHVFVVIGALYLVYLYVEELYDEAIKICYSRYTSDEIKKARPDLYGAEKKD